MPLFSVPGTKQELNNRSIADVQQELPASSPSLRNKFLFSIINANTGRVFEFYSTLDKAVDMLFANTATGEALLGWGSFKGLTPNPATQSQGNVVFTGTAGTVIPLLTQLTAGENQFQTDVTVSIVNQTLGVSSITRSGTTATVTTTGNHNLSSNITANVAGAVETPYNGAKVITVTGLNTLTYIVEGSPSTPATGTITIDVDFASIPVTSVSFGNSTNLIAGAELKLSATIPGANNSGFVDFNTLGGGSDAETETEFRVRVHDAFRFPIAYWNANYITRELKTITGITRVFVIQPGGQPIQVIVSSLVSDADGVVTAITSPVVSDFSGSTTITIAGANEPQFNITTRAIQRFDNAFVYALGAAGAVTATGTITLDYSINEPGVVTVYFLRDNDDNPIPDGAEVAEAQALLLERKPADRFDGDVRVLAPTAVPVPFVFTALSPNTPTMQSAVTASLQEFFDEKTSLGVDLTEDDYRCAIRNTIDLQTGQSVSSFALSTPTGTVAIASNEIPTLVTPTYP